MFKELIIRKSNCLYAKNKKYANGCIKFCAIFCIKWILTFLFVFKFVFGENNQMFILKKEVITIS